MAISLNIALLGLLVTLQTVGLYCAARSWIRLRSKPVLQPPASLEELRQEVAALREAVERLGPDRDGARARVAAGPRAHRFDRAAENAVAGPTLIAVPNLASASDPASAAAGELARKFEPIWSLAESGLSAEAIAARTGQPVGQVELILGLRRQAGAVLPHHVAPGIRY
jgi:hypothetical protein